MILISPVCSCRPSTDDAARSPGQRQIGVAVSFRFLLIVAVCTLASACSPARPGTSDVTRIDLLAFSTTVSFSVYAPPDNFHTDVVPALEQRMRKLEKRWRSFGDGSLGTLNDRLESGECATTDADTLTLIQAAMTLSKASNGLFDPTLGIEVDAWGFRDHDQAEKRSLPDDKSRLTVENGVLCADGPLRIDLGGIAKGAIVLDLRDMLGSFNIRNAIINIGGDLLVLGQRGDIPWRVAVQHPRGKGVIGTIEALPGDAIFSSGDYHRRLETGDQVAHHIIDPRTRSPSAGAIATTVLHQDPLIADAAATALLVGGHDSFLHTAAAMDVSRAILIDQSLRVHQLDDTGVDLPEQLRPPE